MVSTVTTNQGIYLDISPDISTAYSKEKEVYACFVKCVRQGASVRRHPLSLRSRLISEIGAAEEPVLGFPMYHLSHLAMEKNSRWYSDVILHAKSYHIFSIDGHVMQIQNVLSLKPFKETVFSLLMASIYIFTDFEIVTVIMSLLLRLELNTP